MGVKSFHCSGGIQMLQGFEAQVCTKKASASVCEIIPSANTYQTVSSAA
jgi:hypothetical protein